MKTLLLIEDSSFLRTAQQRVLIQEGYHVMAAADGEEALLIARDKIPDLIILDMLLPKLSGPEVLRSLRGDPTTRQIPVLVLSSLSERNQPKLLREGAFAYVQKEALRDGPKPLLDAVRSALP